jgi:hypothetical protein
MSITLPYLCKHLVLSARSICQHKWAFSEYAAHTSQGTSTAESSLDALRTVLIVYTCLVVALSNVTEFSDVIDQA